jgi:hypothetical protein
MAGPALLEGERVHRVVRPHPLARMAWYAPGLSLLALGIVLAAVMRDPAGRGFAAGLDAEAGPLAVPLFLAAWWLGLVAVLLPWSRRLRAAWPLGYAVAVAAAGGFVAVAVSLPDPSALEAAAVVPWWTLGAAVPPLAAAEALRRARAWWLTDLRLVRREGLLRVREESWRLTRVERVEPARRGPAALDLGDLVLRGKDPEVRLEGVRPLARLRAEVEMLIHTAPEAAYLGDRRESAERVMSLLQPRDEPPP